MKNPLNLGQVTIKEGKSNPKITRKEWHKIPESNPRLQKATIDRRRTGGPITQTKEINSIVSCAPLPEFHVRRTMRIRLCFVDEEGRRIRCADAFDANEWRVISARKVRNARPFVEIPRHYYRDINLCKRSGKQKI
jgi:hypothetical protein